MSLSRQQNEGKATGSEGTYISTVRTAGLHVQSSGGKREKQGKRRKGERGRGGGEGGEKGGIRGIGE